MALDPNEKPNQPIAKFESMLKTDDVYFFDAEDFEDIIHHYLNNGKVSLAKKAIKIGLTQHPGSIALKLLHVEILVFENNLEIAEKWLDELQLVDSNNEEIFIQRANICSKKNNHEAAVEYLQKALNIAEDSFDIYSLLGMEYLFMDNYTMAKDSFMKCLSYDEHDYASLYNIVYCFEFLEDQEGAIDYLNKYLNKNPYCQVAWHQLGKQYHSRELYKEALSAFDFAIISDESFIGAYFEKGKVLEKLGRYFEAIDNYQTTIKIDDPTSHAYLRIGKCYEKLKNEDLAKYYYYQTVHEDPLLDKGWLAITDYYIRQENFEKALFYINKAINIDGENAFYWKKCAHIHLELQHFIEADYSFKQAVELGNYELETWQQWAYVAHVNKDLGAAIQILLQGLEFYPEEVGLEYQLASYYFINKQPDKAKIHFTRTFKNDPEKLAVFEKEYPQYLDATWVKNVISEIRGTSE